MITFHLYQTLLVVFHKLLLIQLGHEFEEGDSQGWMVVDAAADMTSNQNSIRPLVEEVC